MNKIERLEWEIEKLKKIKEVKEAKEIAQKEAQNLLNIRVSRANNVQRAILTMYGKLCNKKEKVGFEFELDEKNKLITASSGYYNEEGEWENVTLEKVVKMSNIQIAYLDNTITIQGVFDCDRGCNDVKYKVLGAEMYNTYKSPNYVLGTIGKYIRGEKAKEERNAQKINAKAAALEAIRTKFKNANVTKIEKWDKNRGSIDEINVIFPNGTEVTWEIGFDGKNPFRLIHRKTTVGLEKSPFEFMDFLSKI